MRYWKFAKKIRPLLTAALFPFGTGVCAQEMPCAGDFTYTESRSSTCDYQSQSWINTYGKQGSYVPGELLNNDVVKTIVVAIHIWQKDDGSGNWENNQTTIDDLTYAAEQLNGNMFTNNDEPSDPIPGTASMPDTKIRVSLMGIFFHQNTAIWGLTCFDGATITAAAIAENPEVVKALNLHVINPTCCDNWSASGAATGGTQGTSASTSQVVSETWGTTVNTWVWPQHWAHEMGHNLSLKHTYNSEHCQFSQGDSFSMFSVRSHRRVVRHLAVVMCVIIKRVGVAT